MLGLLSPTEIFTEPFERLCFDIVGPFTKSRSNNFMYILTAICPSSHFCWAIPLRTSTASVVADGLISVFKDSGIPREILTDRGTQFSSKIVKHVCSHFGIHQLKTASYCPQSNGILEHFHGTLYQLSERAAN